MKGQKAARKGRHDSGLRGKNKQQREQRGRKREGAWKVRSAVNGAARIREREANNYWGQRDAIFGGGGQKEGCNAVRELERGRAVDLGKERGAYKISSIKSKNKNKQERLGHFARSRRNMSLTWKTPDDSHTGRCNDKKSVKLEIYTADVLSLIGQWANGEGCLPYGGCEWVVVRAGMKGLNALIALERGRRIRGRARQARAGPVLVFFGVSRIRSTVTEGVS